MVTRLPVKRGISAPALVNIPKQWSPEWFRDFITQFLVDIDLRNALTSGITIAGNVSGNNSQNSGNPVTAGLSPIPNDTVLGNVSGSTATPTPLNSQQLGSITSTVATPGSGVYSMTGEIAVLRVGSGGGPTTITGTAGSYSPFSGETYYGFNTNVAVGSTFGTASPATLFGYTITQLNSFIVTVPSQGTDTFEVQASSDPGISLFTSITIGSNTRTSAVATYSFSGSHATWSWGPISPTTLDLFQTTGAYSASIA